MPTEQEIYSTLIPWLYAVGRTVDANFQALVEYQNAPRPAASVCYGTVNIVNTTNHGIDTLYQEVYDEEENVDVAETIIARREYMISVNVYRGKDASGICEILKASLRSPKVHRNFFTKGSEAPFSSIPVSMGFIRASGVRRLPVIVVSDYEDRAQFDVWFNVALTYQDVLESVEEINVDGSLYAEKQLLFNFDLNIKTT